MKLCVIEGDGIGKEVIPATVSVLKYLLPDLEPVYARAGWDCFRETGQSLPDETIDKAQSCGAVLFGAAGSPSYPVDGYFSPIVRLRRIMNTHANLRPTTYIPVPTARTGVDLLVVRENTEGVYVSQETSDQGGDRVTAKKVITRKATERIAHTAYKLARTSRYHKVTVVHKGNVLPQSDGMFRRICLEIGEQYPETETDELLIDTAAYWMVKEPTRFNIILTLNQYGDILSDMAAAWGGGLGLAPALNLGESVAIAEPVHGSAPDIAGRGIANPTAALLSTAMMLRYHWQLAEASEHLERAVRSVLNDGDYTADIQFDNALSTTEFTQRIIDKLEGTSHADTD
ncbi:MAG: isocitrate/isopropylmalate dehydrogenase family protein [Aggregatilineales bacterium]